MRSGAMWKLTGIHCALLVAALLLTWPTPERLASATPPFTLKWLLLTELVTLAYVTLVLTSDSLRWGEGERLRPAHWVAYGASPAWAVVAGRILALWYVLSFLTLTAFPIMVLAHGASPVPLGTLGAWSAAALGVLTFLGVIGLLIGCRFQERSTRLIAVDVVCLLIAIALIIVGDRGTEPSAGPMFYLNPTRPLTYILDSPGLTLGGGPDVSWLLWWVLQIVLLLAAASVTVVQLKRWIRRQPPHVAARYPLSDRSKGGS